MPSSAPLFPPSLFRERTQFDTCSEKASEAGDIDSIHPSGHWVCSSIHLITAVSALLLQHALYHTGVGLITTVPTLLQQHRLYCCKCHHFYCRQHPYYLSIILVNAVQALLLHLRPHCWTVSHITITAYRYSSSGDMQYGVACYIHPSLGSRCNRTCFLMEV